VSIRLLRDIGIGYAVRYAQRFGFRRESLPRDLSLALGSGTLTPLELARGYTIFANGGYMVEPYLIDHVLGPDGQVVMAAQPQQVCVACIEEQEAQQLAQEESANASDAPSTAAPQELSQAEKEQLAANREAVLARLQGMEAMERDQVLQGPVLRQVAPRVLDPQVAFLMNTMMRDVIQQGTGRGAMVLNRKDLAGKTGTTNDQRDAWFAGFNRNVVTIAWVGFDNPRPLGERETGARAALPMWIDYMRTALAEREETPLIQPPGIVTVRIDTRTGELAHADSPEAMFEYFRSDHVPTGKVDSRIVENPDSEVPVGDITEQIF
jgi:penicillin-binding protein 1A